MKQSCTFVSCDDADVCGMVKGCVRDRFPGQVRQQSASAKEAMRKGAPALNGQKPSRLHIVRRKPLSR